SFVLLFLLDKLVWKGKDPGWNGGRHARGTLCADAGRSVAQGPGHIACRSFKVVSTSSWSMWFFSRSASRSSAKHNLSTSFWSFCTDLSANSALASACTARKTLTVNSDLCIPLTFSSLTSRDFRLLPTTRSSSSSSTILLQKRVQRDVARDKTEELTCNPFSHLFVFLVGLLRDEPRLSQLVLEQCDPVVLHVGAVLQRLANALVAFPHAHFQRPDGGSPFALVSGLRGLFQFLGGDLESFLRAFQVLLEQLDAPVTVRRLLALWRLQGLILLFQLVVGLGQLLLHLIQLILDALNLLLQAADFLLGLRHVLYLLGAQGGIPGLLFRGLCSVHRIILLQLHRLHLLLDGLHLGCFRGGGGFGALDEVGPRTWDALGR
ncbi:unnamed protein product, partial [Ixodes persulcatus]